MTLTWRGRTRVNLASDLYLTAIERLVENLSDFLGPRLMIDDTYSKDCLDVNDPGGLRRVVETELARSTQNLGRLREMTARDLPYARRFGSVHFVSEDGTKNVHLSFDEYKLSPSVGEWRFGNAFSIEAEVGDLCETELDDIAAGISQTMFENDLFDHGFCCLADEYDAKNIDRSVNGVSAVGLDASKYLPGFYWGNYFGRFLCELIGRDRLLTVPGCRSIPSTSGVILMNKLPPSLWRDAAYKNNQTIAIAHVGRHLFFEKNGRSQGELFGTAS